ncbi:hypothetical protein AB1N83_008083 [Pleurotus pulmonarius]
MSSSSSPSMSQQPSKWALLISEPHRRRHWRCTVGRSWNSELCQSYPYTMQGTTIQMICPLRVHLIEHRGPTPALANVTSTVLLVPS